jgi:hypothetical protein
LLQRADAPKGRGCLKLGMVNSTNPWGEKEFKKTIMRSTNNGFHGGLFKNNKFIINFLKKKLLCTFVCLSPFFLKPRDFTMFKSHKYPLVITNLSSFNTSQNIIFQKILI